MVEAVRKVSETLVVRACSKEWSRVAACLYTPCLLGLCLGSACPCEAFLLAQKEFG